MGRVFGEVKTFEVNYVCDDCNKGFMRSTGTALTSVPVQYPHRCTYCLSEKNFGETYPHRVYKGGTEAIRSSLNA
jgi:transposase-like protein